MPVQKFAPMTKEFPAFDCDAHVTEPPWLWERAKDYLTKDEFEALKGSCCFDPESNRLIATMDCMRLTTAGERGAELDFSSGAFGWSNCHLCPQPNHTAQRNKRAI